MEEAVTDSIIRQANETFGQVQQQQALDGGQSFEKENKDESNSIINVETFIKNNKPDPNTISQPEPARQEEQK